MVVIVVNVEVVVVINILVVVVAYADVVVVDVEVLISRVLSWCLLVFLIIFDF